MATRKGATKTDARGRRFRWNGRRWVQIKAQGNGGNTTSSRNRSVRQKNSNARVTRDNVRTSTGVAKVTGGEKPQLPPGKKGGPIVDQRVEKAKVSVDQLKPSQQKQLTGSKSKPQLPSTSSAKTQPQGQASSRRADAAARLNRSAQGTTGPNRVGQPAGAANRYYGADRVTRAVGRAQRTALTQNALRILRGAGNFISGTGQILGGRDDGSGSALRAALVANDSINAVRGSTAEERNNRPARRGMSSIPPSEGTGGVAETLLGYGAGAPQPAPLSVQQPAAPVNDGMTPTGGSMPAPAPASAPSQANQFAGMSEAELMRVWAQNFPGLAAKLTNDDYGIEYLETPEQRRRRMMKGYPGNQNY